MFLLCVDMYIGTLYPIPEFWPDRASNMVAIMKIQLGTITPKLTTIYYQNFV
jgi:hypothetical protein